MNIENIELVARHAWPALEEHDTKLGVLRCAAGVSRRANSLNLDAAVQADGGDVAAVAEDFFFSRGLPAVVKIMTAPGVTPGPQMQIDASLHRNRYQYQAETRVLVKPLKENKSPKVSAPCSVHNAPLCNWLKHWHHFAGHPESHFQIHRMMLDRIQGATFFALAYPDGTRHGEPVSCGLGVVSQGMLAIYGIATVTDCRGRGYGRSVVEVLLDWGAEQALHFSRWKRQTSLPWASTRD